MENHDKRCSSLEHKELNAVSYCCNCKVFMCNKCQNFHSNLLNNHKVLNIEYYLKESFTGFCKEENHFNELEYFCKNHNLLCCAACIAKVKTNNNGKHTDCAISKIDDIIDEKKNKLNENIKYLQKISDKLENSINELKDLFGKITESKEELKIKIQKIFTKLRSELNNREEELLIKVDNVYEETFFKEEAIKECEKLPNKIKLSLEKGKSLENDYNEDKKVFLINDCIKIENNLKEINTLNENVDKFNKLNKLNIKFTPDEDEINSELERIKSFGKINLENLQFLFESSSIINKDINKQNTIINWIQDKIKKRDIKFKLIFKMTENGYEGKSFHKYCDNKGPTLILINLIISFLSLININFILKVKTNKNRIFGGFTPLEWENNAKAKFDLSSQTFIFSLNLNKKYDMISVNKKAIQGFSIDYGPNFGDYDFGLTKNLKEGMTYANLSCNYLSNGNLELTGGKGNDESFQTEEFEVFQVIY